MTRRPEGPDAPRARAPRAPGRHTSASGRARRVPLRSPDGPLSARIQPLDRPPRRAVRRSWMARFMDQFGWRAYAIPVLTVASVLFVSNIAGGASGPRHHEGKPAATAPTQVRGDASQDGATQDGATQDGADPDSPTSSAPPSHRPSSKHSKSDQDTPSTTATIGGAVNEAALPKGAPVPQQGNSTFTVVPGSSKVAGTGPLRRYEVEVEGAMSGIDAAEFAKDVEQTLGDGRSWSKSGVSLQRVDSGPVDFRVTLTSVLTIRAMCGYEIKVETSCYNGGQGRAFINVARWIRGAVAYGSDLAGYRHYVINHEVGHALGHGHMKCPKAGAPAPLMMEQTLGITTPGVGACRPNPWPYVDGKYVTGPPTQGA